MTARIARSKKRLDMATVNRQIGRILQQNQRAAARFAIALEPDVRLGPNWSDPAARLWVFPCCDSASQNGVRKKTSVVLKSFIHYEQTAVRASS